MNETFTRMPETLATVLFIVKTLDKPCVEHLDPTEMHFFCSVIKGLHNQCIGEHKVKDSAVLDL